MYLCFKRVQVQSLLLKCNLPIVQEKLHLPKNIALIRFSVLHACARHTKHKIVVLCHDVVQLIEFRD